ncbi:hypothetical protein CANCADRAFT_20571, partial [Tortispora caseinolytica NRRL Y-17796]
LRQDDPDGTGDDDDIVKDPATAEIFSSWAIFILIMLLVFSLWTSYYLHRRKIQAVHETVVSIFSGMLVGLIIRIAPGHYIQDAVSFNYGYFFNLLLPPIILNSGFQLHQSNFFKNISSILTFAIVGTALSCLVLGIVLFLWSQTGLDGLKLTLVECISVGATLSATDPVTVLAIFNAYKVDPKLYTLIFGESILNDAVSIVMFETAQKFHGQKVYASSLFKGIGMFCGTFIISMIIGVGTGVFVSLTLKHSKVRRMPQVEVCVVFLLAYASYFFSTGCHMSGIVSLLFCGITLRRYAYYNMSRRTQLATKFIFELLAQLSENFIFVYLGLSLFTEIDLVYKPLFIVISALGLCLARWCAVFPLSKVINIVHKTRVKRRHNRSGIIGINNDNIEDEIPEPYQMILFWGGLRGAVGVALAAGLEGEHGASLRATILVDVVLTVIIFGGTISSMLEIVGIRTGVENTDSMDDDDEFDVENNNTYQPRFKARSSVAVAPLAGLPNDAISLRTSTNDSGLEEGTSTSRPHSTSGSALRESISNIQNIWGSIPSDQGKWLQHLDEQVIKPVLLDS